MARTCSICRLGKREEIDQALLAGEPFRNIARRYGTSPASLFRHKQSHLPATLLKSKQIADAVTAETLFDRLRATQRETEAIFNEARQSKNHVLALHAAARIEKQLQFEARLLGDLSDSAKIAIGIKTSGQESDENAEAVALGEILTLEEMTKIRERMTAKKAQVVKLQE